MAPLKNNNNENRVDVVAAAASTSSLTKATKRSIKPHDSSDATDVPDAKRRKQTVDHRDVEFATPAAMQQNKRGVKRRLTDVGDLSLPPSKNKMRETTATQSVAVLNEDAASASRGDYDTILRNLFAHQSTYKKGKLCDEAKLTAYQVNKFLMAYCEKVNPYDRISEWRLKIVAIKNDDNETDEDAPVPTTDNGTRLLNPSSQIRETDEDGPVPTTAHDTQLIDPSSSIRERLANDVVPPTYAVTSIVDNYSQDDTANNVQLINNNNFRGNNNETILRNLFARQPTYRRRKLCDESKLSVHQVTKFLTAHCEKVNPYDRYPEWRLKDEAFEHYEKVDDKNDEDVQVNNVVSTANLNCRFSNADMKLLNSELWNVTWNEGKCKPNIKGTPGNAMTVSIRDETKGRNIRAFVFVYKSGKFVCHGAKSVADSKRAIRICVVEVEWPFENPHTETNGLETAKYSELNEKQLKSKRGRIQTTTAMVQKNGFVSIMGAKDMDSLNRICDKIKIAFQHNPAVSKLL
jgi:TATA-box binding protein (TBP) (component of TFIID and TFIIIB)